MPLDLSGRAPYAPGKVVVDLIRRHRDAGLPRPISAEALQRVGVSESLAPRTFQALRLLDLVSEDGAPTEAFERFKHGSDEEFRNALARHLDTVYEPVVAIVNVPEADDATIETAFRGFEPHGQRQRMVSLFTALYEAAGVRGGEAKSPAAPRVRAAVRQSPKPSRKVDALAAAGVARFPRDVVTSAAPGPTASDPLIAALMSKLPPSGSAWAPEERSRFLRALEGVLDLVYTEGA